MIPQAVQPKTASVLIFERHALLRAALRGLISQTDGLEVVCEVASITEAVAQAKAFLPDVILLDGRDTLSSLDANILAIKRAAPRACVLTLVDESEGPRNDRADCLGSDSGVTEFCATIASQLGVQCAGCALQPLCSPEWLGVSLSRREKHVAIRVAEGLTSKQIAGQLGVSLRTVHTYRESLARKLGASSAAVVTRFVIEQRLLQDASAR